MNRGALVSSESVVQIVDIHQLMVLVFYAFDSPVEGFCKMPESQTLWKSHKWLDVDDNCWNTNPVEISVKFDNSKQ